MPWSIRILSTACSVLLFTSGASAQQQPSFDCTRARTSVEKAICADSELALLDKTTADLYFAALQGTQGDQSGRQAVGRNQIAFLKVRDACGREADSDLVSCLRTRYATRVEELRLAIPGVAATPADVEPNPTAPLDPKPLEPPPGVEIPAPPSLQTGTPPVDANPGFGPGSITYTPPGMPVQSAERAQPLVDGEDPKVVWGFLAGVLLVGLAVACLYWLPTIVAMRRHHRNRWVILVLNTVVGFTVVGWLLLFIWALNKVDDPIKGGVKYDPDASDPIV